MVRLADMSRTLESSSPPRASFRASERYELRRDGAKEAAGGPFYGSTDQLVNNEVSHVLVIM